LRNSAFVSLSFPPARLQPKQVAHAVMKIRQCACRGRPGRLGEAKCPPDRKIESHHRLNIDLPARSFAMSTTCAADREQPRPLSLRSEDLRTGSLQWVRPSNSTTRRSFVAGIAAAALPTSVLAQRQLISQRYPRGARFQKLMLQSRLPLPVNKFLKEDKDL